MMAEVNHRTSAPHENTSGYTLSEEAHGQLRDVQDCLQLLQLLAQSSSDDPMVPPALWSSCMRFLSKQLQNALERAHWQETA